MNVSFKTKTQVNSPVFITLAFTSFSASVIVAAFFLLFCLSVVKTQSVPKNVSRFASMPFPVHALRLTMSRLVCIDEDAWVVF